MFYRIPIFYLYLGLLAGAWNLWAAVLHAIGLAQFALTHTRANSANSRITRVRLQAKLDQAEQEMAHMISDQGKQFDCPGYRAWCKRRSIKFRYGAVGEYGSIAVIERLIRTLKEEGIRRILTSMRREDMRRELTFFIDWFNGHRPHQGLSGRTPKEIYCDKPPANEAPRFEPRKKWPSNSGCASPQARIEGRRGTRLELVVSYFGDKKHLPVVQLKKAA